MNIFLNDSELEEIKPVGESNDKGLVISPNNTRNEIPDIVKEITAIDAINNGTREAARISGIPKSNVSAYANGRNISDPDIKARITATKYDIQDTAVAKLMETLNLINPHAVEKERDKITILNGLSNLVEKITENNQREGPQQVHLHLYAPNQKKESDYEVIEA